MAFFCDMVLKGPALYVSLWEPDGEDSKHNANKYRLEGTSVNLGLV